MDETTQELHELFYAQTDLEITHKFKAWKKYAAWLENLKVQKLNQKIIKENRHLRAKASEAWTSLEAGLVSRS